MNFFVLCSLFLASMEQTLTDLQDISTTRQEDLRIAFPKPSLCRENHGCSFSLFVTLTVALSYVTITEVLHCHGDRL